ncbi:MAG: Uncharacterized protein G01um101416_1120 [Microgenomates group bacterium Gr01-1014_16]|nr:MAG: Uncharacterized protein G01um101416_1120 [Microgenomates group bacterium Gr01-1014_16]
MDQHPVPQNISSYEFRLVGDMTLKQFLQLAGGAGAGLLIFRLPLPFKAIYAPTEFYWHPITSTIQPSPGSGEGTPRSGGGEVLPKIVVPVTAPVVVASPLLPLTKPSEASAKLGEVGPLSPAEVAAFSSTPNVARQGEVGQTQTQYATATAPPPNKPTTQPSPGSGEGTPRSGGGEVSPKPNIEYRTPITNLGPSPLTPTVLIAHPPSPNSSTTTPNIPPPSLPNILTGLVVSSQNQPQEGAIIEIVANATGLPVRALRTNKTGLFQIATPLPVGEYSLYTDKDGLSFDSVSILADSKIIQPIIIKAK